MRMLADMGGRDGRDGIADCLVDLPGGEVLEDLNTSGLALEDDSDDLRDRCFLVDFRHGDNAKCSYLLW